MEWLVLIAALLLAFVNGANDNFKGVATLFGSGALSYRRSLTLATVSTLLGSLLSLALASGLIHAFSGKGIIPAELLEAPLLASIALAAAITVLLATRLGFPISTTHALVGGIAGAGIVAAGGALEFLVLARAFALPLLVGPILAVGFAYVGLRLARRASRTLGLEAASEAVEKGPLATCFVAPTNRLGPESGAAKPEVAGEAAMLRPNCSAVPR